MKPSVWIVILVLCLLPLPTHGQDVTHHVVIVLDASKSMDGYMGSSQQKKMTVAKEALVEVMAQIQPDTHVGLLVFSSANLSDPWVYPLGPLDTEELEAAIRLPIPNGNTPLGAYIKMGADRLLKARAEQYGYGTYRLLIVTDGEAQDKMLVDQFVPEVMARGIVMDVIGVDMRSEHTLATRVHAYRKADDPQALTRALIAVFAEVGADATDAAEEEAFAQIAPIPSQMAAAMLKALAASGNTPIGEGPSKAAVPTEGDPGATGPPPAQGPAKDDDGRLWPIWFLAVVVAVVILWSKRGKGKSRTRRSAKRFKR
ncbi:MAG: VWA domain-containing protein [Desulfatitalea sp.]|nr:VWA domain-containing protein [Desulfatitalea sp.]NNJ99341.1 VWA domain-containing protein [Desulfatitalea sp.]